MALPFFVAMVVFPAKVKPLLLMGFLVNEANCLKTIDYDRTKVRLALLLLNDFCRENSFIGRWAISQEAGPLQEFKRCWPGANRSNLLSLE